MSPVHLCYLKILLAAEKILCLTQAVFSGSSCITHREGSCWSGHLLREECGRLKKKTAGI